MTRSTCRSIRLIILACLAFYALTAVLLPPLVAWVERYPVFALTIAACSVALGFYWFKYRHELSGKEW